MNSSANTKRKMTEYRRPFRKSPKNFTAQYPPRYLVLKLLTKGVIYRIDERRAIAVTGGPDATAHRTFPA